MSIPLLFGPYGSSALAVMDRLAAAGANAVWFHGFDPRLFDACARHGLAPCVEFATFRADFARHPELIPIGVDGRPIRYGDLVQGVCLSQHAFLEEIEANLRAGVRQFQPTGIWLDYLTYAGWFETPTPDLQESCFCPACIAEFCEAEGVDATTPQEILTHHAAAWTRHKCQRVAAWAARYASIIRESLPTCLIGAYMCPWTPEEFDGALTRIFAQDYARLAASIDIFTPLIYAHKSGRAPQWARAFLEAAPEFVPTGHPVQLILDVLDFPESLAAAATAASPSWGIQIFAGASIFTDAAQAAIFRQYVEEIRSRLSLSSTAGQ